MAPSAVRRRLFFKIFLERFSDVRVLHILAPCGQGGKLDPILLLHFQSRINNYLDKAWPDECLSTNIMLHLLRQTSKA